MTVKYGENVTTASSSQKYVLQNVSCFLFFIVRPLTQSSRTFAESFIYITDLNMLNRGYNTERRRKAYLRQVVFFSKKPAVHIQHYNICCSARAAICQSITIKSFMPLVIARRIIVLVTGIRSGRVISKNCFGLLLR